MERVVSLDMHRDGRRVPACMAWCDEGERERLERSTEDILHPSEAHVFAGLRFPQRRASYLLGRYAAKMALSSLLGEPQLAKIEITSGVFNQPVVAYPSRHAPAVSLSHCAGRAVAVAFPASHPMGVDIELIDADRFSLLRDQLTSGERRQLERIPLDPGLASYQVWTMKEALSKILRCGMTVPWEILELENISLETSLELKATFRNFAQYRACSWNNLSGCVLSLVLPRKTELVFEPL